jgi:hypothetical protein
MWITQKGDVDKCINGYKIRKRKNDQGKLGMRGL